MEELINLAPDYNSGSGESGAVDGVFSPGFSSAPRAKMYQAWVFPELHPDEPQPVLKNWPVEDLEMFVWGYNKEGNVQL